MRPLLIRTLTLCSLLLAGTQAARSTEGTVPIGGQLRAAVMDGLNGPSRPLAAFRGKPLLINLWASWCGPCRAETASLERLAWHDEAARFGIIGISTDDVRTAVQTWLSQSNATIPHFLDHDTMLETMLGANRIPLTVLVDADGRVVERIYGEHMWDSPGEIARIRRAFHFDTPRKAAP